MSALQNLQELFDKSNLEYQVGSFNENQAFVVVDDYDAGCCVTFYESEKGELMYEFDMYGNR